MQLCGSCYVCHMMCATLRVPHYVCHIMCVTLYLPHYVCHIICATMCATLCVSHEAKLCVFRLLYAITVETISKSGKSNSPKNPINKNFGH